MKLIVSTRTQNHHFQAEEKQEGIQKERCVKNAVSLFGYFFLVSHAHIMHDVVF